MEGLKECDSIQSPFTLSSACSALSIYRRILGRLSSKGRALDCWTPIGSRSDRMARWLYGSGSDPARRIRFHWPWFVGVGGGERPADERMGVWGGREWPAAARFARENSPTNNPVGTTAGLVGLRGGSSSRVARNKLGFFRHWSPNDDYFEKSLSNHYICQLIPKFF